MVAIALYQPDIPQNVGAAIRLCACLGVSLHIIEPCGFPWDAKKIRQSAMDYMDHLEIRRHVSWDDFQNSTRAQARRMLLLTRYADLDYTGWTYKTDDILLLGRESAGVPQDIHDRADARLGIAMADGMRSLNVINAGAMVLGEALRQKRHETLEI